MGKELQNNVSVFCFCSLPRQVLGPKYLFYELENSFWGLEIIILGTEVTGPGAHLQVAEYLASVLNAARL